MWQEVVSLVKNNHSFVISSHINPDCDALGSELALAEHLRNLGKKVTIVNSDSVPEIYRFLDPHGIIKRYSSKKHASVIKKADVIFVLDASGGWERLGTVGKVLEPAEAVKICIDHHPDATDFVDVAVVDTDAAATAELIYRLLLTMNGSLSKNMAEALYAAILTDTGSFRFPKTSVQTHRITADLLAAGVDPLHIYSQIYEQYSLGTVQLRGHVLETIKIAAKGQIAYYGLTQSTLKSYGVKTSDLDGFASLGQQIKGVRVVIFCTEASKGRIKISLRSDGTIAINQLAAEYKGGGHASAAGALVPGKLDDITQGLLEKVKQLLKTEIEEK